MDEVSNNVHRLSIMQMKTQESVDCHLEKMELEAEKAAMRNAVLEQQVSMLANTLIEVKDMMQKCPVPTNEPARLVAVHASGAMEMTPQSQAYPDLERCALEVYKLMKGEVAVAINFLAEEATYFPVFYPPSDPNDPSEPQNIAEVDKKFATTARKANVCQHVIHRAEVGQSSNDAGSYCNSPLC